MPAIKGAESAVKKFVARLMHLTPGEAARLLKNTAYKIKNLAGRISIGFKAGVIILLCAAFVVTAIVFSADLSGERRSNNKFNSDAAAVCADIIAEYGLTKAEQADSEGEFYRMSGLSFLREIDFDNDGESELLLAYRNANVYQVEVWGYGGGDFIRLYSNAANISSKYPDVGSWISIYSKSGKFYLGELSAEDSKTMNLLTRRGNKFKGSRECEYDPANDIYVVNGKMNTDDFETIRISNISSSNAENLVDSVNAQIESFGGIDVGSVQTSSGSKEQLMSQAYADIVQEYISKYGEAEYNSSYGDTEYSSSYSDKKYNSSLDEVCFADGLCVAQLIDFNGDGVDELFTVYRYNKKVSGKDKKGNYVLETQPEYKAEVFWWNGSSAEKVYENDGVSQMQDSDDSSRFYILRHNGKKTDICRNTFSYNERTTRIWSGTSRISEMDENGKFNAAFLAKINSNYGYRSYLLNGERVYRREFNEKGYVVPYFCNDDEYDEKLYTVVYLQGGPEHSADIQNLISQTKRNTQVILSSANN